MQPIHSCQRLVICTRDQPTVSNKYDLLQAVLRLYLGNLAINRCGVLGVAPKHFHTNWTAIPVAQQPYDHLLMPQFAVTVVTKADDLALLICAFDIAVGQIVKHQAPILQMPARLR